MYASSISLSMVFSCLQAGTAITYDNWHLHAKKLQWKLHHLRSGLSRPSIAHQPSEPSRVLGLRCNCAKPCYSWVAASTKMKCPDATSTVPNIALTDIPNRKAKISAEMMSAASKVGFFYVTGKRITSELTPLYPLVEEMCGAYAVQGMGLHKLILMQRSQ